MKRKKILLTGMCAGVLLVACSSLPPAPPPAANSSVTGGSAQVEMPVAVTADQVSIDPQGLWEAWKATAVAATPYDNSQPPGPTGLPEHIVITFDGKDPSALTPSDPALYLIPVKAYEALWNEAGDPSVARAMQSIYSMTVALQSPPPVGGLPALPYEHVGGGVNDLAVQQGRVSAAEESASKSGYRFVGRWEQSANPVTNQNLRYVYQGFTNDGAYLVAFFSPITTTALPNTAGEVPADQMAQVDSDPTAYMAAQAEALNQLASSDWQPAIDQLDAVVVSLGIDGMQAYGLQGALWKLVAQRNGATETPLGQPENYTVAFGDDGTLAAQADCNRVAGSYTAQGGAIGSMRTQLGPSTMAACGPNSHADLLVNVLASAQNYRLKPGGETLELIQPAGGTVLIFNR
jgi:heat shock protein HslJ